MEILYLLTVWYPTWELQVNLEDIDIMTDFDSYFKPKIQYSYHAIPQYWKMSLAKELLPISYIFNLKPHLWQKFSKGYTLKEQAESF